MADSFGSSTAADERIVNKANMVEAKNSSAGKEKGFDPMSNKRKQGVKVHFRRMAKACNKAEYLVLFEKNSPLVRSTRYLKKLYAPVEGGATGEKELVYVYLYDPNFPSLRDVYVDYYYDSQAEDELMTLDTQLYATQGHKVLNWSVTDHFEKFGWDAVFQDLTPIGEHYEKITGVKFVQESESGPVPGLSKHYEASQMSGQNFTVPPAESGASAVADAPPVSLARTLAGAFEPLAPPPKLRRIASSAALGGSGAEAIGTPEVAGWDSVSDMASEAGASTVFAPGGSNEVRRPDETVGQRYIRKLNGFEVLQFGNKGVLRYHAGEAWKKSDRQWEYGANQTD